VKSGIRLSRGNGFNYLHDIAVFLAEQELTPPEDLSRRSVSKTKAFCTSLAARRDRRWFYAASAWLVSSDKRGDLPLSMSRMARGSDRWAYGVR
jgi:hypothetical protein